MKEKPITKERIAKVMQMLEEIKENGEGKPIAPVLRKYAFGRGDIKTDDVVFVFGVNEIQPIHARRLIEKTREYYRFRRIKREMKNQLIEENEENIESKEEMGIIENLKCKFLKWKESRERERNKISKCDFVYDDEGVLLKVKLFSKNKKKHISIDVPRKTKKKMGRPVGKKESKQDLLKKEGYEDAVVLLKLGFTMREISQRFAKQKPPIYISNPTLMKLKKEFC